MALNILAESTRIQVAAGYESGHTMVFVQTDPGAPFQRLYSAKPHSQPGRSESTASNWPHLSLSASLSPQPPYQKTKNKKQKTPSNPTPVLSMTIAPSKDHYITSSADAILAKHPLPLGKNIWNTEPKPLKVNQTKHAGQQGLQYRSDGKVFATAGWDANARVYSGKTMKELAVLKWHKAGCYATAFAAVGGAADRNDDDDGDGDDDGKRGAMSEQSSIVSAVQRRRDQKARSTHWLAVGAKDGKVSLWDIY